MSSDNINKNIGDENNNANGQPVILESGQQQYNTPGCSTDYTKYFELQAPVSIRPYAHVYAPEIECIDQMSIYEGLIVCPQPFDSCDFTLSQKIAVKVPIDYGVITTYDDICIAEDLMTRKEK